jgi:hypothetical protein
LVCQGLLIGLFIAVLSLIFTGASAETENLSDIRDLIPAGMEIDKETLYELFEPEPIPSEADARFLTILSDEGFEVQQGAVKKLDLIKLTELGVLPDAEGNNADNPYYAFALPRSPGQTVANDHEFPNGMSGNVRLRPNEAA